jgi:hypothetical protein
MMAVTYTSDDEEIQGLKFTCKRCKRVYPFPDQGEKPIRCECGWWYENVGGTIKESFHHRFDR